MQRTLLLLVTITLAFSSPLNQNTFDPYDFPPPPPDDVDFFPPPDEIDYFASDDVDYFPPPPGVFEGEDFLAPPPDVFEGEDFLSPPPVTFNIQAGMTYHLGSKDGTTPKELADAWKWIQKRLADRVANNRGTRLAWDDAQTVTIIGQYYEMTKDPAAIELMKKECDILLSRRENVRLFIENERRYTWPAYASKEKTVNGRPIYYMNMRMTGHMLAPLAYFSFLVSHDSNLGQYENDARRFLDVVYEHLAWYYQSRWYDSRRDYWVIPSYPNWTKVDQFRSDRKLLGTPLMYNSWFIMSGMMEWARRAALRLGVHTQLADQSERTIRSCVNFFFDAAVITHVDEGKAYRWRYMYAKKSKWEDPGHGGLDIFGLVRLYNYGNNPYGLTRRIMKRLVNTFFGVLYKGIGWRFYCDLDYAERCSSTKRRPEEKSVRWSPLGVIDKRVIDLMYDKYLGPNQEGMKVGNGMPLMWALFYKWVATGGSPTGADY